MKLEDWAKELSQNVTKKARRMKSMRRKLSGVEAEGDGVLTRRSEWTSSTSYKDPAHKRRRVSKPCTWDQLESALPSSSGVKSSRVLVGWPRSDVGLKNGCFKRHLLLTSWPVWTRRVACVCSTKCISFLTFHRPTLTLPSILLFVPLINVKLHYLFCPSCPILCSWH